MIHAIFLDLQKVYNALDRSRCLDILEVYGVGPRDLRLLFRYCERLQMVAHMGGYYGELLRGERGVTQGVPLLPTIFNMLVDAVVRHWESLVVELVGWDSSDDNSNMAQPAGRKIWERENG